MNPYEAAALDEEERDVQAEPMAAHRTQVQYNIQYAWTMFQTANTATQRVCQGASATKNALATMKSTMTDTTTMTTKPAS